MDLHDEIARVARELYEKSGYIQGRELENWLEAEKIVLSRHASQEIEEPEGESAIIASEEISAEVEGTEFRYARQDKEEDVNVFEEMAVEGPFITTRKRGPGTKGMAKIITPAKKGGPGKKTAAHI